MSSNVKPLLSICIPTYNRAELLRSALYSIVRQAADLGGQVEVVVSDNCSPDHTPEVIAWAETLGPVRYHRNAENIGAGRNFLQLAQHLAEGEYCWLLGDDDLLREGAVQEVVSALQKHPNIDCVFVNNSHEQSTGRMPGIAETTQKYQSLDYACSDHGQHLLKCWERIIGLSDLGGLFTYMGSHILRTQLWREEKFEFQTDEGFPSLEATFPHACVVARHMTGKPVLYLGKPLVMVFVGAQEWTDYYPLIALVRALELGDYLAAQGAEATMVKRYRNLVLRASSGCFWRLLRDPSISGREHFHAGDLFRRYWTYSGFYKMLVWEPAHHLLAAPLHRLRGRLA